MNKHEYLKTLSNHLYFLTVEERAEILNDYEEHFRMGICAGKSEYKIAAELGDPAVIAEQYKKEGQYYARSEMPPMKEEKITTKPKEAKRESEDPFGYETVKEEGKERYEPQKYEPVVNTPKKKTDWLFLFKKIVRFAIKMVRGAAVILRYPFVILFILMGIGTGVMAALMFSTIMLRIGGVLLALGTGALMAVFVAASAKLVIYLADILLNWNFLQVNGEEDK